VPVILMIGYWLARRRTALDDAVAEAGVPVAIPPGGVPLVDTERGRMA
jgi:hypothetical protein